MAQSKLHKELTHKAINHIANRSTQRGYRWATEFFIEKQCIVDAMMLCSYQMNYWSEVVEQIIVKEAPEDTPDYIKKYYPMKQDSIMQPDTLSICIETKVSRSDFLAKFHPEKESNRKKVLANLHYIVTPKVKGILKEEELPPYWGILMQSGRGIMHVKPAKFCEVPRETIIETGYKMLWSAYSWRATQEDYFLKYRAEQEAEKSLLLNPNPVDNL